MTGGAWTGGDSDGFVDVANFLMMKAKHGVIIDGILVWIDIQQKETAPMLWQAQANEYFLSKRLWMPRKLCGKLVKSKET